MDIVKKTIEEFQDCSGKIIGCALRVHSVLGAGFQEVIYQRALDVEMRSEGLSFQRELEMTVFYKGHQIGSRRVDFFVENEIMVELKALAELEDIHIAQALNYLEAYNMQIGLLLNFGSKRLTFKRLINSKYKI